MSNIKRQPTKGYPGDRILLRRIEEYLSDNGGQQSVAPLAIADCLQQKYREYQRRKRNVFRKSVSKVYEWICHQNKEEAKSSITFNQFSGGDDSVSNDSFSEENPDYVEVKDKNLVNNRLSNLYMKIDTPSPSKSHLKQIDGDQEDLANVVLETKTLPLGVQRDIPTASPRKRKRILSSKSRSHPTSEVDEKINKNLLEGSKKTKKKNSFEPQKSVTTFKDIGANENNLHEICKLLVHMKHPEVYQQLGVSPPKGVLLHGPPGCGKTLLGNAIAGELDLPLLKLSAPEIVSGVSGESENNIRDLFEQAQACAPCIVFIDEIDAITPKRETAQKEMERRIVAQLLSCMDDLCNSSSYVMVIGATNRVDSIDPALRRAGRFDREISLGIPDEPARKRILEVMCRKLHLSDDFEFDGLASLTPGFVGADLMSLCREAAMCAVNRVFNDLQSSYTVEKHSTESSSNEVNSSTDGPITNEVKVQHKNIDSNTQPSYLTILSWLRDQPPLTQDQLKSLCITVDDFMKALPLVQPSAKREGFATVPDVTWNDIGALDPIREELQLAILAPVRNPAAVKALGLTNPPGILLAGPPGCGKTLLAKAIANESGINFISVKGPELLNMYVGESERAVRQCFQRARNSSPCVIFFDELDALCPRRSNVSESGSTARVVNQLLTEMDGLESRKQVYIMGATNRPDIIDPAILRPGRLDKILYIGIPTAEDRIAILKTITKNGTKPLLGSDVSIEKIARDERCNGFSGADLAAIVREAAMATLKKVLQSTQTSSFAPVQSISTDNQLLLERDQKLVINNEDFEMAFSKVRCSVSKKDQEFYNKMKICQIVKQI
ncbi:nuclear valosin-containing protein-like [Anneissia japonica]|uniref:nuclear valosin-containing protein-like n=1 Tax=Anneissia japonica TaxID=1529436 RepID=UPI001425A3F7|nr:nuclear valosin-containing protein-like [Anneissia japonica]